MSEIKAKEIRLVPLAEIKLNPKNRNKHPDDQIDRLVEIIRYQGFRRPVTISTRTGFLNCGEGRYLAAKKIGMAEIPATFQDYDSPEQEFADAIADNALDKWASLDHVGINQDLEELGADFNIEMLGIKDFEKADIDELEPGADENEIPTVRTDTITKPGDIWQLGRHRLMCGDATNIQHLDQLMAGERADMIFTDPPYGIGFKYNSHQDSTGDEYKDFCRDWFHAIQPLSDFIVVSTGWAYNGFWYSMDPKDTFYWLCKNKRTGGSLSHFRKVEPLFIWGKPAKRYDFDFFEQTTEIEKELKGQHTCPKPVSLIEAILAGGKKKGIVLDVFGGSGTTLIACEKTKRSARLLEIDPKYCDVIVARWEKYARKTATRLSGTEMPS